MSVKNQLLRYKTVEEFQSWKKDVENFLRSLERLNALLRTDNNVTEDRALLASNCVVYHSELKDILHRIDVSVFPDFMKKLKEETDEYDLSHQDEIDEIARQQNLASKIAPLLRDFLRD